MSIQAETHHPAITVGDRCRRARLAAGYRKPRDLAAVAPLSENTIRKYEIDGYGIRGPRPSTLDHWARACRVTVPWLLHGDPDDGPGGTVTPIRTENRKSVVTRPIVAAAA